MAKTDSAVRILQLILCASISCVVVILYLTRGARVSVTMYQHKQSVAPARVMVNDSLTINPTGVLIPGVHFEADYDPTQLVRTKEYLFTGRPLYKLPDRSKYEYYLLSYMPLILYFPHFLSDEECDNFVTSAEPLLRRSEVAPYKGDNSSERIADIRTSNQAWLEPANDLQKAVENRLRDVIHIPEARLETLQILRYQVSQKYSAHHDYFDPALYGKQDTNRVATFYLYFSTVPKGGETWFPRANGGAPVSNYDACDVGLRVRPIKGAASVFFDFRPDGVQDEYSLHGSCPVREGLKWGGTQWFQVSYDSIFRKTGTPPPQ